MPDERKPSLLSTTLEELSGRLAQEGHRPYRAKQVFDWLYEKRAHSIEAMTDLPQALRAQLAETWDLARPGSGPRAWIQKIRRKSFSSVYATAI